MPEKVRSEAWTGLNAGISDAKAMPPTREAEAREQRLDSAQRVRAGGSVRRPDRGDGWRITAADERLLTSATRFGVMTWRQAAHAFYGGVERTATRRLGYLREAGLLRQSRDDEWAGRVLLPSASGTTIVRDELQIPVGAPQQHPGERLLHRLAVTDVGLRFESRGDRVLTEREIRTLEATRDTAAGFAARLSGDTQFDEGVRLRSARDGRDIDRWFCAPVAAGGAVHYPDLVLVTPAGLVAVEVEVTTKPVDRLRQILRGYRDSGIFSQVIYFATGPVGALLHGWKEPAGEWTPGVLQRLSLLPEGPPQYHSGSPVRVQQFVPHDPGVSYRLDMRQMPETWRIDKSEWRRLRTRWEEDEATGRAAKVPFLRWWRDIEGPRQQMVGMR